MKPQGVSSERPPVEADSLDLYRALRPLLFRLDPETAHGLTLRFLRTFASLPGAEHWLRRTFAPRFPGAPVDAFGLRFRHPLGLAAGYDKDGVCLTGLGALGFGHIEVGTVTPEPQPGNPRPRLFRLVEDEALVNRMGFPSRGAEDVVRRLRGRRPEGLVVGVSLGKGASTPLDEAARDYLRLFEHFHPVADYLVINISSPNTLGLRRLQARAFLDDLLRIVAEARRRLEGRRPPVLVKVAPELGVADIDDVVAAIADQGLDGIIATNTTTERRGVRSPLRSESGGLSGRPQFARTLDLVGRFARATSGRIPVIACGGIASRDEYIAALDAGASLVQVYTAVVYQGPAVLRRLADPG